MLDFVCLVDGDALTAGLRSQQESEGSTTTPPTLLDNGQ